MENGAQLENSRSKDLVLASVADACSRFEDVLSAMQPYILSDPGFGEEERRLYSKANREIFIRKKNQILTLVKIEKSLREAKATGTNRLAKLVADIRGQTESELKVAIFELIDLLENYMLNRIHPGDNSALPDYHLLKADIWKYFWEICADKDKVNSLETSESAYKKAMETALVLHPTHPTRLRAAYSYVILMEQRNQQRSAPASNRQVLVKIARETLHAAVMQLEDVDPLVKYESVQQLQLLKEFILQRGQLQEEEEA